MENISNKFKEVYISVKLKIYMKNIIDKIEGKYRKCV